MQTDLDKNSFTPDAEEAGINIRQVIERYLRFWPWLVLSSAAGLFIAFLVLRYTTPIFESKATILFHRSEEKALEGLSALSQLGLAEPNKKLGNEIMLMKTPSVLNRVVRELQLNISYSVVGRRSGKERESYADQVPFQLQFLEADSIIADAQADFQVIWRSNERYELTMN